MKLNKEKYDNLIKDEIIWLRTNTPPCQERQHIISVLKESVSFYYTEIGECKSLDKE